MSDAPYDEVNEGSDLSFPASDPPAWMARSAHAAPTHATAERSTASVSAPFELGRSPRAPLLLALGITAAAVLVAVISSRALARRRC